MPSAFLERGSPPGGSELEAILGKSSALWAELRAELGAAFAPLDEKWSFAGKTHGWALQLKQKTRTVLYLVPCRGHFVASLALNQNGYEAAIRAVLPASVLDVIRQAPTYPEGRGVRLAVRHKKDVGVVRKLASIRMANLS